MGEENFLKMSLGNANTGLKSVLFNLIRKCTNARARRMIHTLLKPYVVYGGYKSRLEIYERVASRQCEYDGNSKKALLRMHAHVIDKGLARYDWELGHSRSTLEKYIIARNTLKESDVDSTIKWADSVVARYREAERSGRKEPSSNVTEFQRIAPEPLFNTLSSRSSCRNFREIPVTASALESIALAANEAASSCNRQTILVYGAIGSDQSREVLRCFKGFTGFSSYVPAACVFAVDLRSYHFPKELFVPTLDCGLGIQNAVLMAHSLGLSMTLLSWGSRTEQGEKTLRKLLNIPDYVDIVVGGACGFPDKVMERPSRRDLSDILKLYGV